MKCLQFMITGNRMAEETKKRRKINLNIGTIIFLVIVIYLAGSVIRNLGREKLAVYEVGESVIDDEIKSTGLIIRKESLELMEEDGYINYYLRDGARVKKGGIIYTIDTSGEVTEYLKKLAKEKNEITSEDKKQIFEDLRDLSERFSDDNFAEVYSAADSINYDRMAYSDTLISDNKKKLIKKFGKDSYIEVKAPKEGLVSYFSDGLETLSFTDLDVSVFSKKAKMKDLRTKEKVEAGTPVYRLIRSQKWKLVLPVTEDEYKRLSMLGTKDIKTIQVTFLNDNFTTRAEFECKKKDDGFYTILSFEDYVQRYMNQRYLSVRLLLSETKGLKIPTSALLDREVFRIPARFLTKGSDSDIRNQVNILTIDKKGEKKLRQKKVNVYQEEDGYVSIGADGLKKGDIISSTDKTDRFTLIETAKIQGVFMVNRGYAVFKPVMVIRRNEDYCIILPEESDVVLYDRIILNSNTIKENDVIY